MLLTAVALGSASLATFIDEAAHRPTMAQLTAALDATALEQFGSYDVPRIAEERASETFLRMESSWVPDHLLIAVIISGATRRSPVETAQKLLLEAGGDIARLDTPELYKRVEGVGDAARARLLAAEELYRRSHYRDLAMQRAQITSPEDAVELLRSLSTGPYERLSALYVDRRNNVVGTRMLTLGSDGFTVVDPRQIFRPAIELRASGVIMAHQHPSGSTEPSPQDIDVTRRVDSSGRVLGINLLDHLIVTPTEHTSMKERGFLH